MSQHPQALSLSEVPPEEYLEFADALREFRPHSYQIEGMLRAHLKYAHFDIFGARLYAPTAAPHRHHLAVIAPVGSGNEIDSFSIYWSEHHLSDDDVCQLLQFLPFDSWKNPYMVRQIPLHLQPKMDGIMAKLSDGELHLFTPIPLRALILTADNIPPVPKLPEGYQYGTVDGSSAEEIRHRWIGSYTETVRGMSQFLEALPSVGVFYNGQMNGTDSSEGSAEELVSYAAFKHGSDLGMTFTKEDHRRKGLASAATIQLAHKLHLDDIPAIVIIDFDYDWSFQMHKGIGFVHFCDVAIPFYFPKNYEFETLPSFSNFVEAFSEKMQQWNATHKSK